MRVICNGVLTAAILLSTALNANPMVNNHQSVAKAESPNVQQFTKGDDISVTLGHEISFESAVLNEQRKIIIHLPEGYYTSKESYPVLYLLDGKRHLQHAVTAKGILAGQGLMPESIIVAVTNNSGTRGRDLGRENGAFLKFIKQEVIAYIDQQYRTSPFRTLFGHSMAGAFSLNVLATDPKLFNQYIAASPFLQVNNYQTLANVKALLAKETKLEQSLYFTLTDRLAEGDEATDALAQLTTMIEQESPSMHWRYEFIQNQIHMTTPFLTLYAGLAFVNQDYRAPTFDSLTEFNNASAMKSLTAHYQQRALKYGGSTEVPERVVRRLAFSFMRDEPKQAIALFAENAKRHPESPGALFGLGRGYENNDESVKAMQAYKDALALAKQQSADSVNFLERQVKRYQRVMTEKSN